MNDHPTIAIRPAEDDDCPALAALLSQSTGLETTVAQVRARLVKSRGVEHPIVAELGDQVAGFASLKLTHCLGEDHRYAEVSELFVTPLLRQQWFSDARPFRVPAK